MSSSKNIRPGFFTGYPFATQFVKLLQPAVFFTCLFAGLQLSWYFLPTLLVYFAFHIFRLFGGLLPEELEPLLDFIGVCNILGGISYDSTDTGRYIVSALILVAVNVITFLRLQLYIDCPDPKFEEFELSFGKKGLHIQPDPSDDDDDEVIGPDPNPVSNGERDEKHG